MRIYILFVAAIFSASDALAFAVPLQQVRIHDGRTLGIAMIPGGEEMLIDSVAPGSPAELAGIRAADTLLRVNGTRVTHTDHSALDKALSKPDAFKVVVQRGGVERELTVPAAEIVEIDLDALADPEARLDAMLGEYTVEVRLRREEPAPVMATGSATIARSHDGHHVHEAFRLEWGTGAVRGDEYLTWNGEAGRYELVQLESSGAGQTWMVGDWHEDHGHLAFRTAVPGDDDYSLEYRVEPDGTVIKDLLKPAEDGSLVFEAEVRYVPTSVAAAMQADESPPIPLSERNARGAALRTLAGTGNLREAFNAHKDKPRLLVLLSPT